MAFVHGKNTVVLMQGFNMSNFLNSVETDLTADVSEVTVFNSSNVKSYVGGNKDTTLSAEGLFDGSTVDGTVDTFVSTVPSSSDVLWSIYPNGTTLGSFGNGIATVHTEYSVSSPVDDVISMTVSGQSVSGRERIHSLKSIASETSNTGVGTGFDSGAGSSSTQGGVGYLQKLENLRSLTSATIQHSNNNSTWDALISFTASTARGAERIAVSGTVKRYTRAIFQQAASTLNGSFNMGFDRK